MVGKSERIGGRYVVVVSTGATICFDEYDEMPVVLKPLPSAIRQRWAALTPHPNVITCRGHHDDLAVLEWIEGALPLDRARLDAQQALAVAIDIVRGLRHIETHGALTPANILIDPYGVAHLTNPSFEGDDSIETLLAPLVPNLPHGADLETALVRAYVRRYGEPPRDPTAVIPGNRGRSLVALERHDVALPHLDQALAVDEADKTARYQRARALAGVGRCEDALEDFNAVISSGLATAPIHRRRARVYRHLGRYEQAIADYTRAIALAPHDALLLVERATVYRLLNRPHEALEDCNRALALDPTSAKAYFNRGETYAALGQQRRAREDWEQTIAHDPDMAVAYASIGVSLMHGRKLRRALVYFQQAADLGLAEAQRRVDDIRRKLGQHSPG